MTLAVFVTFFSAMSAPVTVYVAEQIVCPPRGSVTEPLGTAGVPQVMVPSAPEPENAVSCTATSSSAVSPVFVTMNE